MLRITMVCMYVVVVKLFFFLAELEVWHQDFGKEIISNSFAQRMLQSNNCSIGGYILYYVHVLVEKKTLQEEASNGKSDGCKLSRFSLNF